jgi:hypothetical protein
MGWSRKLDTKWTPNPNWIPDDDPDYRIHILHVLPAVPKGSTQLWQVIKCTITTFNKDCKKDEEVIWITDIINIGERTEIADLLTLRRDKKEFCFVGENCEHTVGFDDGDPFEEYQSERITEKLAAKIRKRMKAPKASFTTDYAWRSKDKKCEKCDKGGNPFGLEPGEEALRVGGVGEYLPERLTKRKQADKKAPGEDKKKR